MSETSPLDEGAEMETVTSADGTEIAYKRTGSGPPLVLVHGATLDHRVWELSSGFSTLAENVTVYAVDRRGHGRSGDAAEYEAEREFEDIAAVVDSIDEPVTLLGHSAGGFYTLEAALRTDNPNRLVLYEPAMRVNGYPVATEEARAELVSLLEAGKIEEAYVYFLEDIAEWTSDEIEITRSAPLWHEYLESFPGLLPRYGEIPEHKFDPARFADFTTPTLLLTGSESGQWSKDTTEALKNALPNNRVVTFEGHGHCAMFTAPERFIDEVLAFIRKVD